MAQSEPFAIRTIIHPSGEIELCQHKWLCTSPIHYRNILISVTMHYTSDPGSRFIHDYLPLDKVQETLDIRGYTEGGIHPF